MKKLTIGKKEYDLAETLFDINDERFNVFKQYLLQTFEKIDKPLFAAAFSKYVSLFNAGDHVNSLLEWHNYKRAVELRELNYDAYSFCFALLVMEKGESPTDTTDATQLRKLEEMRKEGLSRGLVEETVVNFMKASHNTFGVYLQMLDMMKPPLQEEFLKE